MAELRWIRGVVVFAVVAGVLAGPAVTVAAEDEWIDFGPAWPAWSGSLNPKVPAEMPAAGAVEYPEGYKQGIICNSTISNAGASFLHVSAGAEVWTRCYYDRNVEFDPTTYSGYSLINEQGGVYSWGGGSGWRSLDCVDGAANAPELGRIERRCTVNAGDDSSGGVDDEVGLPLRPYVADGWEAPQNRVRLATWAQIAAGGWTTPWSRISVGSAASTATWQQLPPHPWAQAYWFDATPAPPPWPAWWPASATPTTSTDATPEWPVGGDVGLSAREMRGVNTALRNGSCVQCFIADPIDSVTGNLFMPVPGVAVPGRGAGLSVQVGYNSAAAAEDSEAGFGWMTSLGMRLEAPFNTEIKTVVQETGSTVSFFPDGSDGWEAPERFVASLERDGTDWVFTRNRTEVFRFDELGRLIEVGDLFGNSTTLTYPSATSTKASAMTDAGGRSLTITWDGDRLDRVTEPTITGQAAGRYVEFDYDAAGDLRTYRDLTGGVWT